MVHILQLNMYKINLPFYSQTYIYNNFVLVFYQSCVHFQYHQLILNILIHVYLGKFTTSGHDTHEPTVVPAAVDSGLEDRDEPTDGPVTAISRRSLGAQSAQRLLQLFGKIGACPRERCHVLFNVVYFVSQW